MIVRGLALHVDGCPIAARSWNGKSYANVMDDCTGCQHLRGIEFADQPEPDPLDEEEAEPDEPFERPEGGHVLCGGFW